MPADDATAAVLTRLVGLPGVADAVEQARTACTELRWHPALRRRIPEAAAESRVRGARASALLEGADVGLSTVRDLIRGAQSWPSTTDPVMDTLRSAVQATAEAEHVRAIAVSAPNQALARLHVAAGSPLLSADEVGRPRAIGEDARELMEAGSAVPAARIAARLAGVRQVLSAVDSAPALVVAAVVHAEVAVVRPFLRANPIVARALERALIQQSGLDPTGVVVPEVGHHREGVTGYAGALSAWASGTDAGMALWLRFCAGSVQQGAVEGTRIADAVLAGRLG
ncbi:hypothetical protein ACMYYO_02455 [Dermacoccaceae bacterium W4C1]